MFKLSEKRTIKWPVTVDVPQDGGTTAEARFEAEFEILGQDEMDAIIESGQDLLDRVLTGWGADLRDETGAAIPYTPEMKAKLLRVPYARAAIYRAYGEIQRGAGARKNSRTPRAGG
jgi:hypothetical protein